MAVIIFKFFNNSLSKSLLIIFTNTICFIIYHIYNEQMLIPIFNLIFLNNQLIMGHVEALLLHLLIQIINGVHLRMIGKTK